MPQTFRNVGIDFMRLLAMFLIGLAHCCGISGLTLVSADCPLYRGIMALFVSLSQFPVALFALIGGYVCVCRKWKISRGLILWAQVVFYVVLFYVIAVVSGQATFNEKFIYDLFPITGPYWYFNAYSVLFLLMPLLNAIIIRTRGPVFPIAVMALYMSGCLQQHCIVLCMYVVGGYLRLHQVNIKPVCYIISALISVLITGWFAYKGLWDWVYSCRFLPSIILAISLLLMLKDLRFKSSKCARAITTMAPFAFGCYLLQCHPFVYGLLWTKYQEYASSNLIPWVIGMTFALFFAGLTIDAIRQLIFHKTGIIRQTERINHLLENVIARFKLKA